VKVIDDMKARLFGHDEPAHVPVSTNRENRVVMYTTRYCPFCTRARAMLQQKQVAWREIAIDGDLALRREMIERSGRYTVPQIWIGETHIGGCNELLQLERTGELGRLLSKSEGVGHE